MDGSVHTSPLKKISSKALKKISENELKITLFSTVSLLALTGCGGGGGGGIFATSGAGGGWRRSSWRYVAQRTYFRC